MIFALGITIKIGISIFLPKQSIKFDIEKSDIENNTFSNFSYKTYNAKGKEILLTSDKVSEEKKNNYVFENMKASFVLSNGEQGEISSDITKATNNDKTVCEFIGNVRFITDSGLLMKSEKAFADFNAKIIFGNTPVSITKNGVDFSGDNYHFDINEYTLTLTGAAKGFSEKQNKKISSEKLVIQFSNDDIKNLNATGNSSFLSSDYELFAGKSIIYEIGKIYAESDVRLLYKKDGKNFDIKSDSMKALLDKKSSINEVFAYGNLIIKSNNAIVRSNNGIFKGDKIIAIGNVIISNAQGDVFGEIAELNISTGDISIKKSSGIVNDNKES